MPRKYSKKPVKRTYKRKGYKKSNALANRVKKLETHLKAEKKHIVYTPTLDTARQFAQSDTLAYNPGGGFLALELTPPIANGSLVTERTGNKVNPTGCVIDFVVGSDTLTTNKLQWKAHIVRARENTYNPAPDIMTKQMFEQNIFSPSSAAIDWHSRRDIEFMRQYQIMKTVTGYLKNEDTAGEVAFSQRKVALRMPKNCEWCYNNTVNTTTTDRYFIVFVADNGVISLNTGGLVKLSVKWFFLDN